jgi:nicotinamidase-related amidase
VAGSEDIIPLVGALTDFAHARHIPIVASADDHDRSHPEISDTPDWRVIEPEPQDPGALRQRVLAHRGDFLLHKHTLDVCSNANALTLLRALEPEAIALYGVATDFCDRSTVEGLLRHSPRSRLFLVTDAIRAIDPREGDRLVAGWLRRGVQAVTAADAIARGVLDAYLPAEAV